MQTVQEQGFGNLLRHWRTKRNLSQLNLATKMETTSRHISFLETGRSKPSHTMVLRVSDALDIPFRERNFLFQSAGFKPHYRMREIDSGDMTMMSRAIDLILKNHLPFPGFVIDRYWNLIKANEPGQVMLQQLLPGLEQQQGQKNLLLLMFTNTQLTERIENWHELAKHMIQRVRREAFDDVESQALIEQLKAKTDLPEDYWDIDLDETLSPVMPMVLNVTEQCRLSMLSTVTTFGTPVDIMAQEVRIELVFPADDVTEGIMRNNAVTQN